MKNVMWHEDTVGILNGNGDLVVGNVALTSLFYSWIEKGGITHVVNNEAKDSVSHDIIKLLPLTEKNVTSELVRYGFILELRDG